MYLIVELQKLDESTLANNTWSFKELDKAQQKYHQVLAYAAVSDVLIHSALIIDDTGMIISNQTYVHHRDGDINEG